MFDQVMAKNGAHAHIRAYVELLAIFGPIFMRAQDNIIYRLELRYPTFHFWPLLVPLTVWQWDFQTRPKSWPVGQTTIYKSCFRNFQGCPPNTQSRQIKVILNFTSLTLLQVGDEVLNVNGHSVSSKTFSEMISILSMSQALLLTVKSNNGAKIHEQHGQPMPPISNSKG